MFRVGYFARVAPEKGLHVLADAYLRFRRRLPPDAPCAARRPGTWRPTSSRTWTGVKAAFEAAGRGGEFTYRGTLDRGEKINFLRRLDLLSVPATYDEPKGMFLLEAMACGVPVVQPRRGAFTEVVERTGGGVLVEPDDPDRPGRGVRSSCGPTGRGWTTLGQRAFTEVRAHYSIERSADRLLEVYRELVPGSGADDARGVERSPSSIRRPRDR